MDKRILKGAKAMKIQKIITEQYGHFSSHTEEIQKALDDGWTIACAPAVVPAFEGDLPEVIYIVEKELDI